MVVVVVVVVAVVVAVAVVVVVVVVTVSYIRRRLLFDGGVAEDLRSLPHARTRVQPNTEHHVCCKETLLLVGRRR